MKSESARIPLGRAIRAQRIEMEISESALAEKVGLSFTYIGGLERGERNVSLDQLHKIAEALGIKLSALLMHAESIADPIDKPIDKPIDEPN